MIRLVKAGDIQVINTVKATDRELQKERARIFFPFRYFFERKRGSKIGRSAPPQLGAPLSQSLDQRTHASQKPRAPRFRVDKFRSSAAISMLEAGIF